MNTFVIRVLLVASAAALIAAPAVSVASAGSSSAAVLTTEQSPSPTPTATVSPTATPVTTTEPTHSPIATRTPEPTHQPSATRTPGSTPTAGATAKPTPPTATKPDVSSGQAWEMLVRHCLESTKPDYEMCLHTLSSLGISAKDFKAKVDARLEDIARHQTDLGDLETLLRKCIESNGFDSETCMKAWKLSGLSMEDFKAMILKRISSGQKSEFSAWLQRCIESHDLYGQECYRAFELSGLSSEDFDKKIQSIWAQKK